LCAIDVNQLIFYQNICYSPHVEVCALNWWWWWWWW